MTVRIEGVGKTLYALRRVEDRTNRRSRAAVRKYARRIAETAREYAPQDEGDLESAIRHDQEARGSRGRLVMHVGIDHDLLGPGYTTGGFDYAYEMHENYPYPVGGIPNPLESGKPWLENSYRKQQQGKEVGGKFLERALDRHEDALRRELAAIFREADRL